MKVCDSDALAIPASVLLFLLCFEFTCFVRPPRERKFLLQREQVRVSDIV